MMDKTDLEASKRLLLEYADSHMNGNKKDAYHIALKREHTLEVLKNAEALLASLNWPESTSRAALYAALFHDVGRFPQYIRYKTFLDRESTDHGILGTIVLGQHNFLDALEPEERHIVRAAVAMHNRKDIPGGISEMLRHVVEVVRDADKLDIIRVMVAHFTGSPSDFPVVILHAKDEPEAYSRDVYDDVLNGVQGDYKKMVYVNDFKMLLCGWVNDFVFRESRRLAHERGLVRSLLATLPDYPEMAALRTVVTERLTKDL